MRGDTGGMAQGMAGVRLGCRRACRGVDACMHDRAPTGQRVVPHVHCTCTRVMATMFCNLHTYSTTAGCWADRSWLHARALTLYPGPLAPRPRLDPPSGCCKRARAARSELDRAPVKPATPGSAGSSQASAAAPVAAPSAAARRPPAAAAHGAPLAAKHLAIILSRRSARQCGGFGPVHVLLASAAAAAA